MKLLITFALLLTATQFLSAVPLLETCTGLLNPSVKEVTHTVHDESGDLVKTVHKTVKEVQSVIAGASGQGKTVDSLTNTVQHAVKHAEDTSETVVQEVPNLLRI